MHPTLVSARLRLRPATLADVDALHALWTEPKVLRYLWDGQTIVRETAEETVRDLVDSFDSNGYGLWLAEPRGDSPRASELIGFGYVKELAAEPELEIGYGLAPRHWGCGYATEIARELLRFGFETLGRQRLYALTDLPNTASVEVMKRAGMRFDRQTDQGAFGGTIWYVIHRRDWPRT